MTTTGARAAANAVLITAGIAAAYVVLTRPSLRRLARRATRWWLGASVPVYLAEEVRHAWMESSRPPLT